MTEERSERIREALIPWTDVPAEMSADEKDGFFMDAALRLAALAAEEGEVPVGCVIVRDGRILTGAYNTREGGHDATAHAETDAISEACRLLGGWRLTHCTLYVTLEPCPMCAGAVWNARVPRVVYGIKDAKAGALGSVLNMASYPLNFRPEVTSGVRETECRDLLRQFFAERRR